MILKAHSRTLPDKSRESIFQPSTLGVQTSAVPTTCPLSSRQLGKSIRMWGFFSLLGFGGLPLLSLQLLPSWRVEAHFGQWVVPILSPVTQILWSSLVFKALMMLALTVKTTRDKH